MQQTFEQVNQPFFRNQRQQYVFTVCMLFIWPVPVVLAPVMLQPCNPLFKIGQLVQLLLVDNGNSK